MRDLLADCMASTKETDAKTFQQMFCNYCRNRECSLAHWQTDKFTQRISTQEDRLLSPKRVDPKYYSAKLADFKDMLETALQIELADRKGDWTVPEALEEVGAVTVPQVGVKVEAVPLLTTNPPKITLTAIPSGTNTSMPAGGIMIDGAAPVSGQKPVMPQGDPWAVTPKKGQFVKPGAHIRLGDKNE